MRFWFAFLLLTVFCGNVSAISGRDLVGLCGENVVACGAYISGVHAGMQVGANAYALKLDNKMPDDSWKYAATALGYCFENIATKELIVTVTDFLNSHPKLLEYEAEMLVNKAFREKYPAPCDK